MAEIGLDISAEVPKALNAAQVQAVCVVITMGCNDACPVLPANRYFDRELPDPAGLPVGQIRPIRDDIAVRVPAPGRASGRPLTAS